MAAKRKSLADEYPAIAAEWHPTRNGNLNASAVTCGSDKKIWWQCKQDPRHTWETTVANRVKPSGCPYCSGKLVLAEDSLEAKHPTLASEWHPTKNHTLKPNEVAPHSNKRVWWKCDVGSDHEWEAIINNRTNGRGCPVCAGKKIVPSNSLATLHKDLTQEWDTAKNLPATPYTVSPGSNDKYWWICKKDANHRWLASPNKRTSGRGCPFCAGRAVNASNSLQTKYPNVAAQWHPTRNGSLKPAHVTSGSDKKVWWLCSVDKSHQWRATISNRTGGQGCPYCSGRLATSSNNLQALLPDIAKEWHSTRNGDIYPSDVKPRSNRTFWWQCPEDPDHEWEATVEVRRTGAKCPLCSSLAEQNPMLASQWHTRNNGPLTPFNVKPASGQKVWWTCPNDSTHEWEATIASRNAGRGCPICSGRLAHPSNSLATLYPDLAKEWHPTLNGDRTPHDITPGSGSAAWWICSEDKTHCWETKVSTRVRGAGCSICAGKLVTPSNSLSTLEPTIAEEWHPEFNDSLSPDDVTTGSGKRVWWRCRANSEHIWDAPVNRRTSGIGCPHCRLVPRSKDELYLAWELKEFFNFDIDDQSFTHDNRVLYVDILIPSQRLVIEYDGAYWHQDNIERDEKKTKKITDAGYQVMRVRENPLTEITDLDLLVNQGDHKEIANEVLIKLNSSLNLRLPGLQEYLKLPDLVNRESADRHILKLLKLKSDQVDK